MQTKHHRAAPDKMNENNRWRDEVKQMEMILSFHNNIIICKIKNKSFVIEQH